MIATKPIVKHSGPGAYRPRTPSLYAFDEDGSYGLDATPYPYGDDDRSYGSLEASGPADPWTQTDPALPRRGPQQKVVRRGGALPLRPLCPAVDHPRGYGVCYLELLAPLVFVPELLKALLVAPLLLHQPDHRSPFRLLRLRRGEREITRLRLRRHRLRGSDSRVRSGCVSGLLDHGQHGLA